MAKKNRNHASPRPALSVPPERPRYPAWLAWGAFALWGGWIFKNFLTRFPPDLAYLAAALAPGQYLTSGLLKALPGPPRAQPAAPSDDDDADADWLDDLDDEAWTDDEIPSPAPDPWPHRPARVAAEVVADLLTALAMIDPPLAGQAVAHMLAWPQTYGLDEVLVPAARRLFGADPAPVASIGRLREACATHLRARIAEPLAPPADWRRDATLPCGCPRCTDLARFLADPARETWVFKAAEADRRHVEGTIQAAKSDVRTATDRRGRPYSLVCTKTQASYDRRASQRAQDLRDMSILGG